jgi:hypothetical protein
LEAANIVNQNRRHFEAGNFPAMLPLTAGNIPPTNMAFVQAYTKHAVVQRELRAFVWLHGLLPTRQAVRAKGLKSPAELFAHFLQHDSSARLAYCGEGMCGIFAYTGQDGGKHECTEDAIDADFNVLLPSLKASWRCGVYTDPELGFVMDVLQEDETGKLPLVSAEEPPTVQLDYLELCHTYKRQKKNQEVKQILMDWTLGESITTNPEFLTFLGGLPREARSPNAMSPNELADLQKLEQNEVRKLAVAKRASRSKLDTASIRLAKFDDVFALLHIETASWGPLKVKSIKGGERQSQTDLQTAFVTLMRDAVTALCQSGEVLHGPASMVDPAFAAIEGDIFWPASLESLAASGSEKAAEIVEELLRKQANTLASHAQSHDLFRVEDGTEDSMSCVFV